MQTDEIANTPHSVSRSLNLCSGMKIKEGLNQLQF